MTNEQIINSIKSCLVSPMEPSEAYGISLKARIENLIKSLESEVRIFELPVREGKRGYQVFNGDKWLPLKIKELNNN